MWNHSVLDAQRSQGGLSLSGSAAVLVLNGGSKGGLFLSGSAAVSVPTAKQHMKVAGGCLRSEERRVGQECRSRLSPDPSKKKTKNNKKTDTLSFNQPQQNILYFSLLLYTYLLLFIFYQHICCNYILYQTKHITKNYTPTITTIV